MAVNRIMNWLGQERIDLTHLRLIESAVAGDFDAVGQIFSGGQAQVIKGFTTSSSLGTAASTMTVNVSGATFIQPNASESGSIFQFPTAAAEALTPSNTRVVGGFQAGTTNYVGITVQKVVDENSVEATAFMGTDGVPFTTNVPIAKVIDWRVNISTVPFSQTPNVVPVAVVVTTANNTLTSVTDARPMYWSLGTGGDVPNPTYRSNISSDTGLTNFKSWMDAVTSRIWAVGGGSRWYSPGSPNNYKIIKYGTAFANGDSFSWSGGVLSWKEFMVAFQGGTYGYNVVATGATASSGANALANGECLVVELDYTSTTAKGVVKVPLATYSEGSTYRYAFAWRLNDVVTWRDPVSSVTTVATASAPGVVTLGSAGDGSAKVAVLDSNQNVEAKGITRGSFGAGILYIGTGASDNSVTIGKASGSATIACSLTVSAGDVTVSTGNVTLTAGGITASAGTISGKSLAATGGDVTASGDLIANASDRRLKTNLKPITEAVRKVQSVSGYLFDWDKESCEQAGFPRTREHDVGVVAQEIQEVLPEAVVPAPFDPDYLTVRYDKLTALLIQAVKEQQVQIERLTARVAELEG